MTCNVSFHFLTRQFGACPLECLWPSSDSDTYMKPTHAGSGFLFLTSPSAPQPTSVPPYFMLSQRLSAWFGADHAGVVKDVLAGKERILPLGGDLRRYPCRTRSACHFSGLNFVRVGFKHMQRARGSLASTSPNPSMARWLGAITEHRVLEVRALGGPCGRDDRVDADDSDLSCLCRRCCPRASS